MTIDGINDTANEIFSKINELGGGGGERYSTLPILPVKDDPPPPPLARRLSALPVASLSSGSSSSSSTSIPEVPSRKLKPQLTFTPIINESDDGTDDDAVPPPLPKKMSRTHSNASTLSNNSLDNT